MTITLSLSDQLLHFIIFKLFGLTLLLWNHAKLTRLTFFASKSHKKTGFRFLHWDHVKHPDYDEIVRNNLDWHFENEITETKFTMKSRDL